MIDLDTKYITYINTVISKYLNEYKLFLFGSRAKGTAKKYSDIDLAIKADGFTTSIKNRIEFEFENSTLPYEVDIVDLNNITEEFKKLINDSMVEI